MLQQHKQQIETVPFLASRHACVDEGLGRKSKLMFHNPARGVRTEKQANVPQSSKITVHFFF